MSAVHTDTGMPFQNRMNQNRSLYPPEDVTTVDAGRVPMKMSFLAIGSESTNILSVGKESEQGGIALQHTLLTRNATPPSGDLSLFEPEIRNRKLEIRNKSQGPKTQIQDFDQQSSTRGFEP